MKKGAIFDMDGTLFDSEKIYQKSWIATAESHGKNNGVELAAKVSGASEANCRRLIHEFYPDVDVDKFFMQVVNTAVEVFKKGVPMMAGVPEILQYFKERGVKMAIASSSSVEVINRNIERADIKKYFDAVVSGDDVENGKPAPDIFLLAAKKLNLPAADCYVFEDSFNGIRGAYAAGCAAIMIPDTVQPTDEIKNLCTVYPSLIDALNSIKN
ncbi:MAG: HAD family phosphatase [Selenomonadaceae bacterium]|nr:HAD family phosphatase [Selenomonadaceae bacterium]